MAGRRIVDGAIRRDALVYDGGYESAGFNTPRKHIIKIESEAGITTAIVLVAAICGLYFEAARMVPAHESCRRCSALPGTIFDRQLQVTTRFYPSAGDEGYRAEWTETSQMVKLLDGHPSIDFGRS